MTSKTRSSLLAILILTAAASVVFSLRAAIPQNNTQTVTYPSGDEAVSGYLAMPSGAGKHPALIVIHEYWGLNDWVKEQAQKFAAQGYVVSTLTDKASVLGWINLANGLPMLLLTVAGGSVADRYDKRRVLLLTQFAQAALADCRDSTRRPASTARPSSLVRRSGLINFQNEYFRAQRAALWVWRPI